MTDRDLLCITSSYSASPIYDACNAVHHWHIAQVITCIICCIMVINMVEHMTLCHVFLFSTFCWAVESTLLIWALKNEDDFLNGIVFQFLDTQVSLAPTHVRLSVGHTFEYPFYQRLWLLYVKSWRKRTPIIFQIWFWIVFSERYTMTFSDPFNWSPTHSTGPQTQILWNDTVQMILVDLCDKLIICFLWLLKGGKHNYWCNNNI